MYLLPRLQSLRLTGWNIAKTLHTEKILPSISALLTPSLLILAVFGFDQTLTRGILSLCSFIRLESCDAGLSTPQNRIYPSEGAAL